MKSWERLLEPSGPPIEIGIWTGDRLTRSTNAELARASRKASRALADLGVGAKTRVGFVMSNTLPSLAGMLGAIALGAVVCSLPTRARAIGVSAYAAQLRQLAAIAETHLLLVDPELASDLREMQLGVRIAPFDSLVAHGKRHAPLALAPPSEPAFIQFSSGTTDRPKGCLLSSAAVDAQLEMVHERLSFASDDCMVSWLPLSHDMGLFGGVLAPLTAGASLCLSSPERFVTSTRSWMHDCAAFGGTLTVAPPFALHLAAQAARRRQPPRRLSLRACVIGAEPIAWRPLADAVDALGESGLTLDRICPAYGLAEATLAVTMATPGAGPHAIEVEPAALDDGLLSLAEGDSPSVTVVSSGTPLPNTVVEVLGDHGVGALRIRTPSLASGHVGSDHPDHFRDSFTTTDIGFQIGAELFVLGRADDIVTLRGEQRSARRIEAACEGHDAIRAGGVAYVVTDAGATLLVELPRGATASRRLELDLADRARSEGAIVDSVRFLAPGQLPRTPSGKLQRFRARALVG